MPYSIHADCIGCTICAKKCPVFCISGEVKKLHLIDHDLCIDCGVCASYCPVDCIADETGTIERKIDAKKRPIAVIREENCTGCEWCVDACPFDCLEMVDSPDATSDFFRVARNVRVKDCVGCKLCEEVCIQKDAVIIVWPDGSYCEDLGVECKLDTPNRAP